MISNQILAEIEMTYLFFYLQVIYLYPPEVFVTVNTPSALLRLYLVYFMPTASIITRRIHLFIVQINTTLS